MNDLKVARWISLCGFCVLLTTLLGPWMYEYAKYATWRSEAKEIERTRPWLDSNVISQIKEGDSEEHARKVLQAGGFSAWIGSPISRQSNVSVTKRLGNSWGWIVNVEFDEDSRVSKVTVGHVYSP